MHIRCGVINTLNGMMECEFRGKCILVQEKYHKKRKSKGERRGVSPPWLASGPVAGKFQPAVVAPLLRHGFTAATQSIRCSLANHGGLTPLAVNMSH